MNSFPPPNSPPTLEALLRLKRAERPSPEFWTEFEQGLRQKQLAAIVEPKPWWLGVSFALKKPAPWVGGLVAGAAAVFMVSVWPTEGGKTASGLVPKVVAVEKMDQAKDLPLVVDATERASSSRTEILASFSGGPDAVKTPDPRTVSEGVELRPLVEPTRFVSLAGDDLRKQDLAERLLEAASVTVSALIVGEALAGQTSGERLLAVVESAPGEPSLMPVEEPSELFAADEAVFSLNEDMLVSLASGVESAPADASPEKSISGAVNSRQARLLAAVSENGATSSLQALAKVRDQVIHRMGGDDELYASISRLGVSGDRLSVRF